MEDANETKTPYKEKVGPTSTKKTALKDKEEALVKSKSIDSTRGVVTEGKSKKASKGDSKEEVIVKDADMKKIVKGEDVKDIIPGKKSNIPIPQGKVTPTKVKLKDYKKEKESREKTPAKKEIEPEIKKGPKASDKASLDKLKDAVDQLKEKVISEDKTKE